MVLPYIDMNPPRVYMWSQTWTPLPPPSLQQPSGSSPCTSPKHAVSCIRHRLAIRFLGQELLKGSFREIESEGGGYIQNSSQIQDASWNWSCGGLIHVILIVLSTADLQLKGQLVSISLRPVLEIVQDVTAYVMLQAGHCSVNFFCLVGLSVSANQHKGYGSEYYL